ncbi:putative protein serine/threonine kinase [Tieghemostelium lacteum]|uniref:Transmembrane protein n=1 Tax=Tieghemostelium lacteum TaxID=361077 RepID=A0A152A5M5_TIELA|nr:putative protein serine/threonine kinase [Tieghemostelium lacteum]|eukprot:KYR01529.1 putative protein serine/threonine kinase [Tieghemostelium lacteum]
MLKSILSVFVLLLVCQIFAQNENNNCMVYISNLSNNTNSSTCGTLASPCPTLYKAIKACEYQNLTQTMTFNFVNNATYQIPNNIQLSIFGQYITLSGNVDAPATITFADQDSSVLYIEEPADIGNVTSTGFLASNLNFEGLGATFVEASVNLTTLLISITNCTFIGSGQQDATLFNLAGPTTANNSLRFSVQNTGFSGFSNTDGSFANIYEGSNVIANFNNVLIQNNTANYGLFTSQNDQFTIVNSQIGLNLISDNPLFAVQSSTFGFSGTTFTSNSLIAGNTSNVTPLIQVTDSTIFYTGGKLIFNTGITGISANQKSNVTFVTTVITQNTVASPFITAMSGSSLTLNQATLNNTATSKTGFIYVSESILTFTSVEIDQTTGLIATVSDDSIATFTKTTYNDIIFGFRFFDCSESNITFVGTTSDQYNQLVSSGYIQCGTNCIANGVNLVSNNGVCQLPSTPTPTPTSTQDSSHDISGKKSDAVKIAIIIVVVGVALGGLVGVAYYFLRYRKQQHHYQAIN